MGTRSGKDKRSLLEVREMKCESVQESTGQPCRAAALWIVSAGTRKSDEQAACCRHLSPACAAMAGAEGRRGAWLSVRKA